MKDQLTNAIVVIRFIFRGGTSRDQMDDSYAGPLLVCRDHVPFLLRRNGWASKLRRSGRTMDL
ncbi:hypothetical protein KP509_34G007300 [Ceratopteris richardii]|uniref:Uncharacterized protein n=1 Tax=Ceratopteris richardii TaxID=49495 RepID=A0A8T2QHS1_CERRI|nr:hypothetical protein KP509_34G007300 [Ceratopteris richardii]